MTKGSVNEGVFISRASDLAKVNVLPQKDIQGSTRYVEDGGEGEEDSKQKKSEHDVNHGGSPKNATKAGTEPMSELSSVGEGKQQEDEDDCEDELSKLLDVAFFHGQNTRAKYDDLHIEFHQLTEKFTRAKELLIENDIPLDESDQPLCPSSGSLKKCVEKRKSSAWRTLFVNSVEIVWSAFSTFLMILVVGALFVLLGGFLSSIKVNSCLNPFYFKSASLYFSRCGELIHDEPPII